MDTRTDYEKLVALFKEFGIGFTASEKEGMRYVLCMEGDAKIGGYNCFFTEFDFDENGAFVEMGAGE